MGRSKLTDNKKKEAADTTASKALLVMHRFDEPTTYPKDYLSNSLLYINLSLNGSNYSAENASEALPVMQRPDTPRPSKGLAGATPARGVSALSNNFSLQKITDVCSDIAAGGRR